VGSRDWTLKRAKLTDETVRLTQRFSQEALIWLTEQDNVETVEVKAWKDRPNQVGRTITIMLTDGSVLDIPLTNGGPINE
jgi:phage gp46-like protein